jgi:hypothetical protein
VDLWLDTSVSVEHTASMFIIEDGTQLHVYTASQPRRPTSTSSPPWNLKYQRVNELLFINMLILTKVFVDFEKNELFHGNKRMTLLTFLLHVTLERWLVCVI